MPWASGEGRKAVLTEYFWQPIRGQPRRVDTNELRQFSQTFWVSSCVKTLMDEISSLDWDIIPKDEYKYEWVEEPIKNVKDFLEHPNHNNESFGNLLRALIKDILEIDAGVIVKVFDINSYDFDQIEPKSGAPMLKPMGQRKMTELYVRDGASFLKEIDKFGFNKGYWQYSYQIPAHPMWFNEEEICYISEHNRSMSCYGYARTQSILDVIKSLHYSTLYNKRFFEETPIPDGALSLLDTNESEMKDFSSYWNNEFKAQPHKIAIVNKDLKWQPFAVSQRELEFLETQKWYYNLVISSFGLTPSELGVTEDVNRATSATQAELVKRKGIRPFLKLIEYAINHGIIEEFGYEGIEFQFIYDDPAEKKMRLDNWQMELSMGVKTINEIRNEMGLEPVEGGDVSNSMASMYNRGQGGSGGSNNMSPEEEAQSSGYKENVKREEEPKKEKSIDERKESIQNPNSSSNRPYGNFKANDKYINMSLQELVDEHKKLVDILMHGSTEQLKEEALHQKEELDDYMDQMKDLKKALKDKLTDSEIRELQRIIMTGMVDDIYRILVANGMTAQRAATYAQQLKQRARVKGFKTQKGKIITCPDCDGDGFDENNHTCRRCDGAGSFYDDRYDEKCRGTKDKGIDDGQYYRDQPISQPNRSSGAMFQPQNPKPTDTRLPNPFDSRMQQNPKTDTNPANIGSSHATQDDTFANKDEIHCPICGQPTLTYLSSLESLPDDVRCTQCGARFKGQDLLNAPLMEEMTNVLQQYNVSNPISIPQWKPKSYTNKGKCDECDFPLDEHDYDEPGSKRYTCPNCGHREKSASFDKEADIDMTVKDYTGIDISKSFPQSINYAESKEYKKLLKDYLSDISSKNRDKIISILKNGLRMGESIRDISKKINDVVDDRQRADLIARTEVVRISNEGNLQRMLDKGTRNVEFVSAPEDGRLCEECKKRDHKIYTIKESQGVLPLHPNCRCLFVENYGD